MADRWSNPSGSKGVERFRVWPSGSDTFDHAELQTNWDKLDAIIGSPPAEPFTVTIANPAVFSRVAHGYVLNDPVAFYTTGALPTGLVEGTTYYVISAGLTNDAFRVSATVGGAAVITTGSQSGTHNIGTWPATLGVDGGIFHEVAVAKASAVPLGSVFPWFKPVDAMDPPDGYEVCDGREVADHEFPNVTGSVLTPDMRNKFVLGAGETFVFGAAGAETGTLAAPTNVNSYLGAPGAGGVGGLNGVTLSAGNLAPHRHTGSVTGWSGDMETWYDDNGGHYPKAGNFEVYKHDAGNSIGTGGGGYLPGQHKHYLSGLSADGGGREHENRPRYVGLVFIMKCRNAA